MERTVQRVDISGTCVSEKNVWETGVGSEADRNCVLRVKKIQSLYRGKTPVAAEGQTEEPATVSNKGKKKRRHREEKESSWRKKVHRTRTAAGEEEETITLNLRKSDTVIDVTITSPVKSNRVSKRHQIVANAAESTGRHTTSKFQGHTYSSTHGKQGKATKSTPTSIGGGTVILSQGLEAGHRGDGQGHNTTTTQPTTHRSLAKGAGVRCLKGALDLVPTTKAVEEATVEDQLPPSSELVLITPSADRIGQGQSKEDVIFVGQSKEDLGGGQSKDNVGRGQSTFEVGGSPSTVSNSPGLLVPLELGQRASTSRAQDEIPNNASFSFPDAIVPSDVARQQELALTPVSTATAPFQVVEFPAEEVGEVPDAIELPQVPTPIRSDEVQNTEELSLNPNPKTKKDKPMKTTPTAETPRKEVTSPKTQPPLKACQITVAACLEGIRQARERSRSPSPLPPPSPPTASPRSRPPRPSISRQPPAPPALKLVPIPNPIPQSKLPVASPEEVTRSLDTLISQLPPEEVAKYFSRKANELEGNFGKSSDKKLASKLKGMMMVDSSPARDVEYSKRELRRQRKEAEKRKKMDIIEKAIRDLHKQKADLEGSGNKGGKVAVPSPRESSKGEQSKRVEGPKELTKGHKVCMLKGARRINFDLVDSSTPTVPDNHIISDPHSIGIWDYVNNVPPCEVNSQGHPIGRFWQHMQSYTHERAPWLFDWDIPWTHQPKERKRAYASRVRSLYPGDHDIDFVMEDVGSNIRQRRQRTRNHMKKNGCKNFTPIAHGLTVKSWNNIWASISNPIYQEKSNKCKVAADARTERMRYTHKLGALGVAGLMKKFEEKFKRPPTEEEVFVGKREGVRCLFDMVQKRYKTKDHATKEGLKETTKEQKEKRRKKQPQQNSSRDSDEESAQTSSDEEEEDGSTKASGGSSSSGSSKSTNEGSDGEEHSNAQTLEDARSTEDEDGEGESTDRATSDHDE